MRCRHRIRHRRRTRALVRSQGIDYVGIDYAGVTFAEPLYPVIEMRQFVVFPLCVIGFALAAGIYPALFAARLVPADAMRRSL